MQTTGRAPAARPDWSAAGERPLTGSPAARRLYRDIAADPTAPRRIDIVGPGGSGKSVLVEALTTLYREAGLRVRRDPPDGGPAPDDDTVPDEDTEPDDTVLVLDDVHALPEPVLERVRVWAERPAASVVLARRPWPCPAGLHAIGAAFAAHRAPLVLGPLDRSGVAGRAALLLGERPPPELVDLVAEQTGGSPALVDRLLVGLGERATAGGAAAVAGAPPASVVNHLAHDAEVQPAVVREFLLARAVGVPLDPEVLGPLLSVPVDAVGEVAARSQATGLSTQAGDLPPLVRHAVLRTTPAPQSVQLRRRFAEIQLDRGGSVLVAARGLLGTAATGSRVAAVLEEAGDEALRECRIEAAEFYDAAVEAGTRASRLAARRAEAALLAGDLDTALRRSDRVLTAPDRAGPGDVVRAGTVAAAALAHRGMLARSAEVYRWLGTESLGDAAILAVPALVGIGELDEAREVLEVAGRHRPGRAPTLLAGAEELLAQGVFDAVAGLPNAALSQLARSAALLEPSGRAALLPDTPVALAALVAMHCGELDVAQSLVDRAVAIGLGGPAIDARHRLLQAWIAMQRGATSQARGIAAAAATVAGPLEPRDELVAAALDVALARRANDLAALMVAWARAREAIVRQPVDLYSLQPLGELLVGAARLREQSWVQPHLEEARSLLARLGGPALWAAPLYWSALQAAITGDAGDAAAEHAAELERVAGASRYAAAMAVAGRVWLRVLAGDIDAEVVEAAARRLHTVGLTWEGGRLASQAAIRTRDRKDMSTLLGCARALQGGSGGAPAAVAPPAVPAARDGAAPTPALPEAAAEPSDGTPGTLSDREREVAELVLSGLTYKQIGEQLFISAKTVEHHVARMRQRLGSESRGELFAHLRMLVRGGTG